MKKLSKFSEEELNAEVNARADVRANEMLDVLTTGKFFRHQLSRVAFIEPCDEPSMTHQSHAESVDVNNIIRQYDRSGVLPPATKQPQYGDVSHLNRDLGELMIQARESYEKYQEAVETMRANAEAERAENERKLKEADAARQSAATSSPAEPSAPATPSPTPQK